MMSASEAATAVGASLLNGDAIFDSVSTDSRAIARKALFVALRGERFDGHRFVKAAAAGGAAAAMLAGESASAVGEPGIPLLLVEDTRLALGRLAAHWRARFEIPLIAVTGSNGKTTVKEMIAAILRAHFGNERVLATRGNLNNEIGLPLTLLTLREEHAVAVVEIGMNHPGETATLAAIAAPTIALVNNAQREHQEFMRSVAEVAREHGAVLASLKPDGIAVINADDEHSNYWRGLVPKERIRDFGIERNAQVSVHQALGESGSAIDLRTPAGSARIVLQVDGRHNALNACAAAACALAAGASFEAVTRGLAAFRAVDGRSQRRTTASGAILIDDTYNENPDSVRAAIDVLAGFSGTRILVLGDMGELGARGIEFHREAGRYARERGIDRLYATGELCRVAAESFGANARHFVVIEELIEAVRADLEGRVAVLVKGSRFMRMERVVQALSDGTAVGEEH